MEKLGVTGNEDAARTAWLIASIYKGCKTLNKPEVICLNEETAIPSDDENWSGFDVIVLNAKCEKPYTHLLTEGGFLLLNSDEKDICRQLTLKGGRLITYGLNNKCCVTASSITEGQYKTIQCCIQRSFSCLNGEVAMQQEFSVSITNPALTTHNVLAAVTAAILCGVTVDEIANRAY